LRLLDKNADVYRQGHSAITKAAPDAVLLVVTDPPDPLAYLTRALPVMNAFSPPARCRQPALSRAI